MDYETLRDLFVLGWRLGLEEESVAAARALCNRPDTVTPDRMLPAALLEIHKHRELSGTAVYGLLWNQAADFLLARSSAPPSEPGDWTIAAEIPCSCDLCARLRTFCRDAVRRVERFKVRKDLRRHLHRIIDDHGLDLDHVTERRGRPYTLVCTKNRAGYKRRLKEYAADLSNMESLLGSAPDQAGGRPLARKVAGLERALAMGSKGRRV